MKSIFGIEPSIAKAIVFAEKNLETLSIKLEYKLEKWLGNTPKSRRRYYAKKREEAQKLKLETLTEEHEGLLEMNISKIPVKTEKQINMRFSELEKQAQEKTSDKETSIKIKR